MDLPAPRKGSTAARWALLSAIVFTGLVGVGEPGRAQPAGAQQGGDRTEWTVLVYNDADTPNIEDIVLYDIERAAEIGSTDAVNVVTLIDRAPDQTDAPLVGEPDWQTAKLFKVERGSLVELEDVGEVDMGDGATFAWFLATGMQMFPADRYAVFINDHGGGVSGAAWDLSTELATGESSHLEIDEITESVRSALQAAGEDRIDLFGYLACLMASYDVAAQIAPYADYLVASEEVTTGVQADLRPLLRLLADDPAGTTAEELGQALVEVTSDALVGPNGFPEMTQSVVDLSRIPTVTQALDSFARAVEAHLPDLAPVIGRAQQAAPQYGAVFGGDPYPLFDLPTFLAGLDGLPPEVAVARDGLYAAVASAIVDNTAGPLAGGSTGLSVYFPETAYGYDEWYPAVAGSKAWASMLATYYGVPDEQPPIDVTTNDLDVTMSDQGVTAVANLRPDAVPSVVGASFLGGTTLSDGDTAYLFSADAQVGGADIAFGWNLAYLRLTDGTSTLDATVFMEPTTNGYSMGVPVIYQSADGEQVDAWVRTALDADGQVTGSAEIFGSSGGGLAPITPAAGDIVAPLVLVESGGSLSYELLSSTAVEASALSVVPTRLPSGAQAAVAIVAFDAAGNETIATGTAVVP